MFETMTGSGRSVPFTVRSFVPRGNWSATREPHHPPFVGSIMRMQAFWGRLGSGEKRSTCRPGQHDKTLNVPRSRSVS